MKFGKKLQVALSEQPEWADHTVDYKGLKSIIKKLAQERNEAWCKLFNDSDASLGSRKRFLSACHQSTQNIEQAQNTFFDALFVELNKAENYVEITCSRIEQQLQRQQEQSNKSELHAQLILLSNFSLLNVTAAVKIVKKFDRHVRMQTKSDFTRHILNQSILSDSGRISNAMEKLENLARADSISETSSSIVDPKFHCNSAAAIVIKTSTTSTSDYSSLDVLKSIADAQPTALTSVEVAAVGSITHLVAVIDVAQGACAQAVVSKMKSSECSHILADASIEVFFGPKCQASAFSEANVCYSVPAQWSDIALTSIASGSIDAEYIKGIATVIDNYGGKLVNLQRLTDESIKCVDMRVLMDTTKLPAFKSATMEVARQFKIDVGTQPWGAQRRNKQLVCFDMDNTLIQMEVIDELAREAGVEDKVVSITEAAMRGELDFDESLRQRVGALKGAPRSIIDTVKSRLVFTEGAKELCALLKRMGYKLAVLSGGFMELATHVQQTLGLDYAFANTLAYDGDSLAGNVVGQIVNAQRKADLLCTIAQNNSIPLDQTVAIGDGANDLVMLSMAGMGIAWNAKPKVQAQAEFRVNQPCMMNIRFLLGISDEDVKALNMEELLTTACLGH